MADNYILIAPPRPTKNVVCTIVVIYLISTLCLAMFIVAIASFTTARAILPPPGGRPIEIMPTRGEILKQYAEFRISYSPAYNLPNWVAYFTGGRSERCPRNTWTTEPFIIEKYKSFERPHERGHLLPAIDVRDSCATFTMTNAAPQHSCFNRGIWQEVEQFTRDQFGASGGRCQVLTAPQLFPLSFKYVGTPPTRLYLPTGFFKVVICGGRVVWSIYLPHVPGADGRPLVCGKKWREVGDFTSLPPFIRVL
jgi:DNA/RNA endonuclease G (NUC1)